MVNDTRECLFYMFVCMHGCMNRSTCPTHVISHYVCSWLITWQWGWLHKPQPVNMTRIYVCVLPRQRGLAPMLCWWRHRSRWADDPQTSACPRASSGSLVVAARRRFRWMLSCPPRSLGAARRWWTTPPLVSSTAVCCLPLQTNKRSVWRLIRQNQQRF